MIDINNFKLSIIIPCYNEKKTIEPLLKKILISLKNYKIENYEIIVVDDNSNDGTKELFNNFLSNKNIQVYFHKTNLGKGAAIHTALGYINGDITIIQDADLNLILLVAKIVDTFSKLMRMLLAQDFWVGNT